MAERDRLSDMEVGIGKAEVRLDGLDKALAEGLRNVGDRLRGLEKLKLWGGVAGVVMVIFGIAGAWGYSAVNQAASRIATLNSELDTAKIRLDSAEQRLAQLPNVRATFDSALRRSLETFDTVAQGRTRRILANVRLAESWLSNWETRSPVLRKKTGDNEVLDSATARTDGFVVVDISGGEELVTIVRSYTAPVRGQWSLRMSAAAVRTKAVTGPEDESFPDNKSFAMPVPKGQRWKIELNGEVAQVRVYWVPLELRLTP